MLVGYQRKQIHFFFFAGGGGETRLFNSFKANGSFQYDIVEDKIYLKVCLRNTFHISIVILIEWGGASNWQDREHTGIYVWR